VNVEGIDPVEEKALDEIQLGDPCPWKNIRMEVSDRRRRGGVFM